MALSRNMIIGLIVLVLLGALFGTLAITGVLGGQGSKGTPTGTPTGTPVGSPTGTPTGTPTGSPVGSPAGTTTTVEDVKAATEEAKVAAEETATAAEAIVEDAAAGNTEAVVEDATVVINETEATIDAASTAASAADNTIGTDMSTEEISAEIDALVEVETALETAGESATTAAEAAEAVGNTDLAAEAAEEAASAAEAEEVVEEAIQALEAELEQTDTTTTDFQFKATADMLDYSIEEFSTQVLGQLENLPDVQNGKSVMMLFPRFNQYDGPDLSGTGNITGDSEKIQLEGGDGQQLKKAMFTLADIYYRMNYIDDEDIEPSSILNLGGPYAYEGDTIVNQTNMEGVNWHFIGPTDRSIDFGVLDLEDLENGESNLINRRNLGEEINIIVRWFCLARAGSIGGYWEDWDGNESAIEYPCSTLLLKASARLALGDYRVWGEVKEELGKFLCYGFGFSDLDNTTPAYAGKNPYYEWKWRKYADYMDNSTSTADFYLDFASPDGVDVDEIYIPEQRTWTELYADDVNKNMIEQTLVPSASLDQPENSPTTGIALIGYSDYDYNNADRSSSGCAIDPYNNE